MQEIMKLTVPDKTGRKIASTQHNKFMSEGVVHRPTDFVPPSLLGVFDDQLQSRIETRHKALAKRLQESIGVPFFSDTGFILYSGDCVDLLRQIRGDELNFDLSVTSPPYNIGKEYEQPLPVEEYVAWCANWMNLIYSVTRANGAFWLNVGYLEVPQKGLCVPIPYLLWNKSPFYLLQEIVWKYGAGVSAKRRLSPRNEKWLFYARDSEDYTFNLDEIRDPNVR